MSHPSSIPTAPPNPILHLSKSLIRPFHEPDAAALAKEANNPLIAQWMRNSFPCPYRIEDATKWISFSTSTSPPYDFAICQPDTSTVIGGIRFKPRDDVHDRTVQIGYWLGEEHWRQGIATEAVSAASDWVFGEFGHVLRLEAEVYEGNEGSVRVLEKAGFVFEARSRNAIEKWGVVRDLLVYCKLREEC